MVGLGAGTASGGGTEGSDEVGFEESWAEIAILREQKQMNSEIFIKQILTNHNKKTNTFSGKTEPYAIVSTGVVRV